MDVHFRGSNDGRPHLGIIFSKNPINGAWWDKSKSVRRKKK